MTSAYPLPVDELTDRVREHAIRIQAWPSLRQVMAEHRVGRPKATAAIDALRACGFNPTEATSPTTDSAVTALHLVPATAAASDNDDAATTAESIDERTDEAVFSPVTSVTDAPTTAPAKRSRIGTWPVVLIALGAFVSIWGGWVGLGELTGFGPIRLLPGIADQVVVNSAITLPIAVEAYAAFALRAWLAPAGAVSDAARRFARWSTVAALALGAAGQIAYHLMVAAGMDRAPWQITAFVSCLPVVVLGCGAALSHLIRDTDTTNDSTDGEAV
ncbi:ABC transporter permease [Pseudonocardia sp. ICBG1142]|uniref:ABC transporter permease n=1 Tax=Pseudonocardia sp. ICBG1142 TaxID=2846760 RepID=UPI001CF65040|nr:ABC transporter permease [Pseudonocardia sp. ICBG1142]